MSTVNESSEKAANVADFLESRLHHAFATMIDEMLGRGELTRAEHGSLDRAMRESLGTFHDAIHEPELSVLSERRPGTETTTTEPMITPEPEPAPAPVPDTIPYIVITETTFVKSKQRGLYLVEPHGRLIYDGKKKSVVNSRELNIEGNWLILSKENGHGLAFGEAKLGPPESVTLETFDARFDEHHVTVKERAKWWAGSERLFLWPIESFKSYEEPREVIIPPGTQIIVDDVEFKPTSEPTGTTKPRARTYTEEGRPRESDVTGDTAEKAKATPGEEDNDMPYSSMEEVNPAIRGIKPPVTLAQANAIAHAADSIGKRPNGPESPWAVAIAQFKNTHTVQDGKWVKKTTKELSEPVTESTLDEPGTTESSKAKWTVAYVNDLPDSSFLFVEGGKKDEEGKTVPRSLRHLPYKDAGGSVDLDHVRNAIARAPRIKLKDGSRISPEKAASLQAKARAILAKQSKKALDQAQEALVGLLDENETDNVADSLRSHIQTNFTGLADEMLDDGSLTREEHVALSHLFGDTLDTFHDGLSQDGELKNLCERSPDTPVPESPPTTKSLVDTVKEGFNNVVGSLKSLLAPKPEPELSRGFKTFEAKDGKTWIVLSAVNAFRDHDVPPEIFSTKAIEDYVARHENDEKKGEFWFWHIPGSKFADIKWQGMSGRFLFEAGPFDDTPVGHTFETFFKQYPHGHPVVAPRGWGESHGYDYVALDRKDGIYNWFEKHETSVLPSEWAANPYNPELEVLTMNAKQTESLRAIGGDALVEHITQLGETKTQELEKLIDFKTKNTKDTKDTKDTAESPETEPGTDAATALVAEPGIVDTAKPGTAGDLLTTELVSQVIEALRLEDLSKSFEEQNKALSQLTEENKALKTRLATLEQDDERRLAEKQLNLPRFSWYRASEAAETEISAADATKAGGPRVPRAIQAIADHLS